MVRKLPDRLLPQLKTRAERHSRSLEAELQEPRAVTKERTKCLKAADAVRAPRAGRHHTERLELLREDRDR